MQFGPTFPQQSVQQQLGELSLAAQVCISIGRPHPHGSVQYAVEPMVQPSSQLDFSFRALTRSLFVGCVCVRPPSQPQAFDPGLSFREKFGMNCSAPHIGAQLIVRSRRSSDPRGSDT